MSLRPYADAIFNEFFNCKNSVKQSVDRIFSLTVSLSECVPLPPNFLSRPASDRTPRISRNTLYTSAHPLVNLRLFACAAPKEAVGILRVFPGVPGPRRKFLILFILFGLIVAPMPPRPLTLKPFAAARVTMMAIF